MRKKSKSGDKRTPRTTSRETSRKSRKEKSSSAGEPPDGGGGTGKNGKTSAPPDPVRAESPKEKDGSGATRGVDRRALRRLLTWLLETNTEQQSLILSAMDMVSDPQSCCAPAADRKASPGEQLRAMLAERTAAVLHPPAPRDPSDKTR